MINNWKKAQEWESAWHGNCHNTYGEEMKQLVYAEKIGLVRVPDNKTPFRFDMQKKSILDIGGGATSLLLKCENVNGVVADPCNYPDWIRMRYKGWSIKYLKSKGEELKKDLFDHLHFDEVWIYNVLQHTEDPEKVIENAKKFGSIIRIFEWIDTPVNIGHIHTLTEDKLNEWLGGEGRVEVLNTINLKGKCFYGIFKGNDYEKI